MWLWLMAAPSGKDVFTRSFQKDSTLNKIGVQRKFQISERTV